MLALYSLSIYICVCVWVTALRKRITLWTNCPWLKSLGQRMDIEKMHRLIRLQEERKMNIVNKYEDQP